MAYTFEFRDEKLVIDFRFYMFKEFIDIWNKDKSRDKLNANRMLYFVFLLCDIGKDNPIKDVLSENRESEAKFRAYRDREKEFTLEEIHLLESAIKLYIELNTTTEERLLTVLDKKVKEISQVVEATKPESETNMENGVVSFVSNAKIITDALSKLSKIRNNRETIVSTIKKRAISEKVRGGLSLSPLVRGMIKF